MAIGWLILYSKYRKARKDSNQLLAIEEYLSEVCENCGYTR
jgi:hypothetical protein